MSQKAEGEREFFKSATGGVDDCNKVKKGEDCRKIVTFDVYEITGNFRDSSFN